MAGTFSKTGASHVLLQLAEVGIIQGYISEQVIDECTRNIQKQLPTALPFFQTILDASFLTVIVPHEKYLDTARGQADDKDVPILAAALQTRADVLVTFNTKDYFPHKSPPLILRPGDVVKAIREKSEESDE